MGMGMGVSVSVSIVEANSGGTNAGLGESACFPGLARGIRAFLPN